MENRECEKLEKKYHELLDMLKDSLEISLNEYREKSKRNEIFIKYKKRVYEEIQKLKKEIQVQQNIIQNYKIKDLELTKENFLLKNKFKHLSAIFKNKRESELLDRYFPDKVKLERIIASTVKKLLNEKFNPKDNSVLFFRKYFKMGLKDYLTQNIKNIVQSEKLAVVISQIILKEYSYFIYTMVARALLDKVDIDIYEEFIEVLITKDLVDKSTTKYPHLDIKYTIDDIKAIIQHYNSIRSKEDVDLISTKTELEEIINEKKELLRLKEELQNQLNELQNKENEVLADIISQEEDNDEMKKQLEEIDESKKTIKEEIVETEKKLTKLQNRELFLKPLLEVKSNVKVSEKEQEYKKRYDKLISVFANALKDVL